MTLCGNHGLRNDNFVADRAVRACRQTGLGAGGGKRVVSDFGVTRCRNYPTILGNLSFTGCIREVAAATGAIVICTIACGGAGSRCCFYQGSLMCMTKCRNGLFLCLAATRTCEGHNTGCIFAGRKRYNAFPPIMTKRRNFCLRNEYFVTDRAVRAFGQAGCCTGSFHRRIGDGGMPRCGNHGAVRYGFTAIVTDIVTGVACCGASRCNCAG